MDNIFLRAFEPNDYLIINKWRNDYHLQKYTAGNFRYVSPEIEKEWVRNKMMDNTKNIYWAICLNDESKRMIGYASINNIDYINRTVEGGGMLIGERDCQDGISIFEATIKILDFAFNHLNMNRFSGGCIPENPFTPFYHSAFGFTKEGVKRDAIYKEGKYHDIIIYSLLKREYNTMVSNGDYNLNKLISRFAKLVMASKKKNNYQSFEE